MSADKIIAVWPCTHGGVLIEPGRALPGHHCHTCGQVADTYLSLQALTDWLRSDQAEQVRADAIRDQIPPEDALAHALEQLVLRGSL